MTAEQSLIAKLADIARSGPTRLERLIAEAMLARILTNHEGLAN